MKVRLHAAEMGRYSRVEIGTGDEEWFDISTIVRRAEVSVDPAHPTVLHLEVLGECEAIGRVDDDTLEALADIIDEYRRRDLLPPPRA